MQGHHTVAKNGPALLACGPAITLHPADKFSDLLENIMAHD